MVPPTRPPAKFNAPSHTPLRILASVARVGSPGGNQRSIESWMRVLAHHDVTLVHRWDDEGPHRRIPPSVRRMGPLWVAKPVEGRPLSNWRTLPTALGPRGHFDVYLEFSNAKPLEAGRTAGLRVLLPAGEHLNGREADFDIVLSQSANGAALLDDPSKHVLCPPPTHPIADDADPVDGLPGDYVLTVFNPYGPVKGTDDLRAIADRTDRPIVWARSSNQRHPTITDLPDTIRQLTDLSPEQLRHVYNRCSAYLCVSRSEGYGWAIADAILLGRPVISRKVGLLSSLPDDAPGVHLFETVDQAAAVIDRPHLSQPSPAYVPAAASAAELLKWLAADAAADARVAA